MAGRGADAARTSLDSRQVAGDAADRPYVESMLRRLGYTDAQIADYLAGKSLPVGKAAPHATRAEETADRKAPRDIEVEYTGPGMRSYRLVVPKQLEFGEMAPELEFSEVAELEFREAPAAEPAPAEGFVHEPPSNWAEVQGSPAPFEGWEQDGWRLYRNRDASGADPVAEHRFLRADEPAPDDADPAWVPDGHQVVWDEATQEPRLEAIPAPFTGWEQDGWRLYRNRDASGADPVAEHGFAVVGAPVRDDMEGAQVPDGHEVAWGEDGKPTLRPLPFEGWEQDGWRLYRSRVSENPDPVKTHRFYRVGETPHRNYGPAHVPDEHEVLWDDEQAPYLSKLAPATPPGFESAGWRLYSKDEGEGDDAQRIFFFSEEQPEDAEPAEVPEGYEVATNPETGRPFLRRLSEADDRPIEPAYEGGAEPASEPRKRVRIVRVRAGSRDEAVRRMESEGRHVLASMPIDIERKVQ